MSARAALHAYLTTALDGEVDGRIYARKAAEGARLPYLRYFRVDGVRDYAYEETAPYVLERFQFDVTSSNADEAEEVGDALIAVLSGFRGDMGAVHIGRCDVVLDRDLPIDPTTKLHRRSVDVLIGHAEVDAESS